MEPNTSTCRRGSGDGSKRPVGGFTCSGFWKTTFLTCALPSGLTCILTVNLAEMTFVITFRIMVPVITSVEALAVLTVLSLP